MPKIQGKDILEVWDFRLSLGSPILYNNGPTWVVRIWANEPGEEKRRLLEEHDTGIPSDGDPHDHEAIAACYEWLRSVRDKYSRPHIELRKPVTRMINEANAKAAAINVEAALAKAAGDERLFNEKRGELQAHLSVANASIKAATQIMHQQIAEAEGGAK